MGSIIVMMSFPSPLPFWVFGWRVSMAGGLGPHSDGWAACRFDSCAYIAPLIVAFALDIFHWQRCFGGLFRAFRTIARPVLQHLRNSPRHTRIFFMLAYSMYSLFLSRAGEIAAHVSQRTGHCDRDGACGSHLGVSDNSTPFRSKQIPDSRFELESGNYSRYFWAASSLPFARHFDVCAFIAPFDCRIGLHPHLSRSSFVIPLERSLATSGAIK